MEDERTSTEIRNELLSVARELMDLLRQVTKPINEINCKLIAHSDLYLKDAVNESLSKPRKTKRLVYSDNDTDKSQKPPAEASRKSRQVSSEPLAKRTCSVCRKPGHRAPNCPEKKC